MTGNVYLCTFIDNVTCLVCANRIKIGERMVQEQDGRWRHFQKCSPDQQGTSDG